MVDYYPLTPANLDETAWPDGSSTGRRWRRLRSAFQAPEERAGSLPRTLARLDPKASYEVTFAETYDVKANRVMTGAELSNLNVDIATAPGSVMIRYRKAQGQGEASKGTVSP